MATGARDAVSVEAGIGPDCRKRHGYGQAQGEADWTAWSRSAAHRTLPRCSPPTVATLTGSPTSSSTGPRAPTVTSAPLHAQAVGALGFTVLAAALARAPGGRGGRAPTTADWRSRPVQRDLQRAGALAADRARWGPGGPGRRRSGGVVVPADLPARKALLGRWWQAFSGVLLVSPKGVTQL